jgi:hypothetical protein
MAKFELPGTGATIDDVLLALKKQHDCFERRFRQLERKVESNRKVASDGLAGTKASLLELKEAFGLVEGHRAKPLALWSARKAAGWIATLGGLFFVCAKIFNAVEPFAWGAAKALWKAAIQ